MNLESIMGKSKIRLTAQGIEAARWDGVFTSSIKNMTIGRDPWIVINSIGIDGKMTLGLPTLSKTLTVPVRGWVAFVRNLGSNAADELRIMNDAEIVDLINQRMLEQEHAPKPPQPPTTAELLLSQAARILSGILEDGILDESAWGAEAGMWMRMFLESGLGIPKGIVE